MPTHYRGDAGEVRALDAYIKLMRAADTIARRVSADLEREGLTMSRFGVLEALFHLGPMCQKDLGRKILKSTGNITMVVGNLERDGLVRRERDTEDRRYITVHLTDEGRERVRGLFPGHARSIAAMMATLTPEEQEELSRLCRRLGRPDANTA